MTANTLVREPKNQSRADLSAFEQAAEYFESGHDSTFDKLEAFPKYVPRQTLAKFLARYEIFKRIVDVNGSIVECGVLRGGNLMAFAKFSAILEPVNHTRRVIGFDTFEGFPSVHAKDRSGTSEHIAVGGLNANGYEDVKRGVEVFDLNRPLNHIPKVELVRGDICQTVPAYVKANPHLVVALLYLDVDLYEPTKVALEHFVERMPRGAIVVFDQLNTSLFPGETQAVHEVLGINRLKIERFAFDSYLSFAVL